jgi:hypothetical protein
MGFYCLLKAMFIRIEFFTDGSDVALLLVTFNLLFLWLSHQINRDYGKRYKYKGPEYLNPVIDQEATMKVVRAFLPMHDLIASGKNRDYPWS